MGGRVFIDKKTGYNPISRIPTKNLFFEADCFLSEFRDFFSKIEFVSSPDLQKKKDHGDIDFVVLPANPSSREQLRKRFDELRADLVSSCGNQVPSNGLFTDVPSAMYLWTSNGRMDHFAYPAMTCYSFGETHQIDIIWAEGENDFRNKVFFYSKPTAFNAVLGHFARSIGYKFSDMGLYLHVTDRRNQTFFIFLTDELEDMMKILMLPIPNLERIFQSPEIFVEWITSSPKFDSELFIDHHNHQSNKDSKKDPFCEEVYRQICQSNIKATIPPARIDFTKENIDIDEKIQIEKNVLGHKILDILMKQIEERSRVATPVISGKDLIEMGFKPGVDFKKIIQDVSEKFSIEDSIEIKKSYIEEVWGNKK